MIKTYGKIAKIVISVAILVLAVIGGISIFKPLPEPELIKTETVVDTVYVQTVDSSYHYTPIPVKEYITVNDTVIVTKEKIVEVYKELTEDDKERIVEDYFTKRHYTDSLETEYGYVVIEEEIWKNRVYSRKYSYDFTVPHITTKITNTVKYTPRRFQLYVGMQGSVWVNGGQGQGIVNEIPPKIYVGTSYRLWNYHYVSAEYDAYRNDLRMGYDYRKGRHELRAEYSTRWNILQVGYKFYIFR